jgi:hypothetical protein
VVGRPSSEAWCGRLTNVLSACQTTLQGLVAGSLVNTHKLGLYCGSQLGNRGICTPDASISPSFAVSTMLRLPSQHIQMHPTKKCGTLTTVSRQKQSESTSCPSGVDDTNRSNSCCRTSTRRYNNVSTLNQIMLQDSTHSSSTGTVSTGSTHCRARTHASHTATTGKASTSPTPCVLHKLLGLTMTVSCHAMPLAVDRQLIRPLSHEHWQCSALRLMSGGCH